MNFQNWSHHFRLAPAIGRLFTTNSSAATVYPNTDNTGTIDFNVTAQYRCRLNSRDVYKRQVFYTILSLGFLVCGHIVLSFSLSQRFYFCVCGSHKES